MENNIDILNSIYSVLADDASILAASLNSAGYECGWSWEENPTRDGRRYPLPVINVYNRCVFIVDIDAIILDAHVSRRKLLNMNIANAAATRRIQIYAFDKADVYPILEYDGDASEVLPKVMTSAFNDYRLRAMLDKSVDVADLRALIADFSETKGTEA